MAIKELKLGFVSPFFPQELDNEMKIIRNNLL